MLDEFSATVEKIYAAAADASPQVTELLHDTAMPDPHSQQAAIAPTEMGPVTAEMLQAAMAGVAQHSVANAQAGEEAVAHAPELGQVLADALESTPAHVPEIHALLHALGDDGHLAKGFAAAAAMAEHAAPTAFAAGHPIVGAEILAMHMDAVPPAA